MAEYLGAGISAGTVFAGILSRITVSAMGGLQAFGEMVKVGGALSSTFLKFSGVLSIVSGFFDYIATGDPLYGLMSAAGSFGGMMIGSAIGSAIFPGVGTILGGMIGGFLGSSALKALHGAPKAQDGNIEEYDDLIFRSGQAPVRVSGQDDLVAFKTGGPIDRAFASRGDGQPVQVQTVARFYLDKKLIQTVATDAVTARLNPNKTSSVQSSVSALTE